MPQYALVTVTQTLTSASVSPWPAPSGLAGTVRVQAWGASSGSGGATATASSTGGGSGGGGYSEEPALAVTPGSTCAFAISAGGAAGAATVGASGGLAAATTFAGTSVTVTANSGTPGSCSSSNGANGTGGAASSNTISFKGGDGAPGVGSGHGGGGGGSAGTSGAGGNSSSATGGTAGSGGGVAGANGASASNNPGNAGTAPGGGAGGARGGSARTGGAGAAGQIVLTYQTRVQLGQQAPQKRTGLRTGGSAGSKGAPVTALPPPTPPPYFAPQTQQRGRKQLQPGRSAGSRGAKYVALGPPVAPKFYPPLKAVTGRRSLTKGGSRGSKGAPVTPYPAGVVNQWTLPVAQSPAWGTSLPGIASAAIRLTPANSVGGGSGTPTAGNWLFVLTGWNQDSGLAPATINVGDDLAQWWRPAAPSAAAGGTRTTIWYQPNIPLIGTVYVSPSAFVEGMAPLVVEVGGLGPWDTVTAVNANSLNGTSLPLAAGAPGAAAFMIAAVTGDSTLAGTALAPAGWTALAGATASNGTDHSSDTVLAAAFITTAAAQSITGTATAAESLSGMIISVLQNGPSPVPAGVNPSWPYLVFEAAFGSGYMTPPDQMVWVNLQTRAAGFRLRSWEETTGPQFELDANQASELKIGLDNPDGALTPGNTASPYYPNVIPGTPVRIRCITGALNRWLVIQRNIERWEPTWDELIRGEVNSTGTDLWSVINKELPTCYRAEVLAEGADLYAWWPMDDPSVSNPTSLNNAAPGSATPLQIVTSPAGLASVQTLPSGGGFAFEYSAIQALSADSGWMYGDSDSAAWQQSGNGSIGTGRYLYCQDSGFPPISGGVTFEGWRNCTFLNTAPPNANLQFGPYGQPPGSLAIFGIGSGGTGTALLFLDTSGHLQFTIGGTTTPIYSGSDLRNGTWFGYAVTITTTGWTVWLNGGIAANVSGSATVSSSWDTYVAGASLASGTPSSMGNAEYSHDAIYTAVLPAARILAHATAAYTAFGQLPAPTGLTESFINNASVGPDGIMHSSTFFTTPGPGSSHITLASYVTGQGGGKTSAPSTPEAWNWCQALGSGAGSAGAGGFLQATGPAAPGYSWYTGHGSGTEQLAASTVENFFFVNSYGSGAAPPAAASPMGDTVANRLERILQSGQVTTPARCIDPATQPVVAALDTGGQTAGSALQAIAASDGGMLFMDNAGNLRYRGRPGLAAQPIMWQLGSKVAAGQIPFEPGGILVSSDPQRILNDIQVTQFDTTGTGGGAASGSAETHGGLVFGPDATRYPAVLASQVQNGPMPLRQTSYLQSKTEIQSQANWLADNFGVVRQRIEAITVKAEASSTVCPAAWVFVLGANVGDVVQVFVDLPGGAPWSGLFRLTRIDPRTISFEDGKASLSCQMDYLPPGGEWA